MIGEARESGSFGLELIAARSSVRSFDGQPLPAEIVEALSRAMAVHGRGPFGGTTRFALVAPEATGPRSRLRSSGRIGTYGLITKVPAFLVGAIARGEGALEDFGYSMEGLILEATKLGLGSCWIGGLFDRGAAANGIGLRSSELLPAVVAVGMPAERRSVAELVTRRLAKATMRKPHSELFFDMEFARPLNLDASAWRDAFEAVRLAPSASNKQPWRIVAREEESGPRFDLFLDEDRIYNSMLGEIHIQSIDMGIAMRHFESVAHGLGLPGAWRRIRERPLPIEAPLVYVASWLV